MEAVGCEVGESNSARRNGLPLRIVDNGMKSRANGANGPRNIHKAG